MRSDFNKIKMSENFLASNEWRNEICEQLEEPSNDCATDEAPNVKIENGSRVERSRQSECK